jgi:polyhydroxyalkanoate synthesis regulator phasin
MVVEDIRKLMEGTIGKLTPAKAQEFARSLAGEDRREQAGKFAQDLLDWQQRNLERAKDLVSREVRSQLKATGVATQADVDALKKRIRALERGTGGTTSGRSTAAKTTTSKKKPTARKPTAGAPRTGSSSSGTRRTSSGR